jgi:uncharacterized protein
LRRATVIIMAALLVIGSASLAGQARSETRKSKVLFIAAGPIHDHKNLPPILKKDLEDTGKFDVTLTDDLNKLASLAKDKPDVVIFHTTGLDFTPEQEKGLIDYVSGGGGWVGIHSASDSFKSSDAYWKMVGGRFSGHTSGTFEVHYTVTRHPAVKGLKDFSITDEDYNHNFHPDARLVVLARRPKDGAPAVWVQYYGKGRVFYTGLGHGKEAWESPGFKALLIKGTCWAANRGEECSTPSGGSSR